ncbi:MAG: NADH:flavin oxidoreductase [Planctomycetes bacterium]|nr:NADH:flavin oxidoreductase [Planctomycetota bacterium]
MSYRRIASLKTADSFLEYVAELGLQLPCDRQLEVDTGQLLDASFEIDGHPVGNRFSILPMEGWDGELDGTPSENTRRRWRRFGASGAKLIWGGEAVAVEHAGRANPNQLWLNESNKRAFVSLREELVQQHEQAMGDSSDLLVGLQLTHSGRFARPNDHHVLEPQILYRHPVLDQRFHLDAKQPLLEDSDIKRIVEAFVRSAELAAEAGFKFVDIKHCHGYLGHEMLSSIDRPGPYGGTLENRTQFLREIVSGIRQRVPEMLIGVRISATDFLPFDPGTGGRGEPCDVSDGYAYAFGGDGTGVGTDLTEPFALLDMIHDLGIKLLCISVGSPYYNPHFVRPAYFPPSDGYQPPEDPLVGVARHIDIVRELKRHQPNLIYVGSGYSYLQEWLPYVGQAAIRAGDVDFVGLGRMVLSYPEMPADVLAGRPLAMRKICRTFSDCTSAPRNGLISGCYPLDDYYKSKPENDQMKQIKSKLRKSLS